MSHLSALLLVLGLLNSSCDRVDKNDSKAAVVSIQPPLSGVLSETLGENIKPDFVKTKSVGVPDPKAMGFVLTSEDFHDPLDFTFGVAGIDLSEISEETSLETTRGILNGSGGILSPKQVEVFSGLCRDIGISKSPSDFIPANTVKKGERLYLMWRSYYSSLAKSHLFNILVNGGAGIECLLSLNLGGTLLHIAFDPAAPDVKDVGGSAKLDTAIRLSLMLPKTMGILRPTEPNSLVKVTEDAQLILRVAPLDINKISVQTSQGTTVNECALSTAGGKTHVANPYGMNEVNYELATDLDISMQLPIAKVTGGRFLKECQGIKFKGLGKNLLMTVTCGQYQAIKDQGVEAACAWDLVAANTRDKLNTVTLPIQMSKIAYKAVDLTKVNEAIQLFPRSSANPIRKGQVEVTGFSKNQMAAFEDLFDLWIAMDEEGYKRDFSGQVKKIEFSSIKACAEGAGAYTPYGGDSIFWCTDGGMKESEVEARYSDPQMFVYRSMLAYHEARHTKNIRHDAEEKSYAACAGTAYSGFLAYQIVTQCDYDYCKVMRDGAIQDYKLELNYDYEGDTTGRKAEGDCKTWSTAMGISGGGF